MYDRLFALFTAVTKRKTIFFFQKEKQNRREKTKENYEKQDIVSLQCVRGDQN